MTDMQRLSKEFEEATYPKDNLDPQRLKKLCTDLIARVKELENEMALARAYPAIRSSPGDRYRYHLNIEQRKPMYSGAVYNFELLDSFTGNKFGRDMVVSRQDFAHFHHFDEYLSRLKRDAINSLFSEALSPKNRTARDVLVEHEKAMDRATGIPKDFGKDRFWRDGRGPAF